MVSAHTFLLLNRKNRINAKFWGIYKSSIQFCQPEKEKIFIFYTSELRPESLTFNTHLKKLSNHLGFFFVDLKFAINQIITKQGLGCVAMSFVNYIDGSACLCAGFKCLGFFFSYGCKQTEDGAQIDIVIDRADNTINIGNNIDVDPNCDNPVFVSFRTYVRNLNIVLEIPRRYALSGWH